MPNPPAARGGDGTGDEYWSGGGPWGDSGPYGNPYAGRYGGTGPGPEPEENPYSHGGYFPNPEDTHGPVGPSLKSAVRAGAGARSIGIRTVANASLGQARSGMLR